ncbi:MAG: hypothetical protein WD688_14535 [Candidatus Binatia bacterium]
MDHSPTVNEARVAVPVRAAPGPAHFIMAAVILSLGYFLIWPVLLLLINSFNAASDWFVEPRTWGLRHWENAFQRPGLLSSLGNSVLIWFFNVATSFPIGVTIAWLLARTKIPFSHTLEFMFWSPTWCPVYPPPSRGSLCWTPM